MKNESRTKKIKALFSQLALYKYDGVLIHQEHDNEGAIEVVEVDGVRSLHFGTVPRQSSMLISDPNRLYLEYARTMSSWLLFKETLNHQEALLIGLGGGSIAKHLLYQFPDCKVNVVEYRKSVLKVARTHFGLPIDSRLNVVIDDGANYVKKNREKDAKRYSIIAIDAFDHEGMAEAICNIEFFTHCQTLLKSDGILAINLWGGVHRPQFQKIALWLGKLFNWKLLFVPVKGRGNIIGLAFHSKTPVYSLKDLRTRAIVLEHLHQIEYTYYLKDLVKHNASVLKNVIY